MPMLHLFECRSESVPNSRIFSATRNCGSSKASILGAQLSITFCKSQTKQLDAYLCCVRMGLLVEQTCTTQGCHLGIKKLSSEHTFSLT